jgi:hypothetical protein
MAALPKLALHLFERREVAFEEAVVDGELFGL